MGNPKKPAVKMPVRQMQRTLPPQSDLKEASPSHQNEIPSRMADILNELGGLEAAAASLLFDISPALCQVHLEEKKGIPDINSKTELGVQLQDIIYRIGFVTNRLNDAIDRLEL